MGIYEGVYRNATNTPSATISSPELPKKKRPLTPSPKSWNKKSEDWCIYEKTINTKS